MNSTEELQDDALFPQLHDPNYLPMIEVGELMEQVFTGSSAIIDNLLYQGTYLLAGAPKIGKSFLVAQIAYHVSSGKPLWGHQVYPGPVCCTWPWKTSTSAFRSAWPGCSAWNIRVTC